jgi:hypothetical protein
MSMRCVDNIRLFLDSNDQTRNPQIDQDAREYAEACKNANERLRRCNDLLLRGLRAEAIHLADAAPNLIDLVTMLDFPGRKHWEEMAGAYQLTTSPGLLIDAATALNAAYSEHAPLAKLLPELRKLALMRAPLRTRLALLRQIAKNDPSQPHWDDDIRAHERALFREYQARIREASKRGATSALAEMLEDLRSDSFLETPPPRIIDEAQKVVQRAAATECATLARELERVHGRLDPASILPHRARWREIAPQAGNLLDEPNRLAAENAIGWAEAVGELQAVLALPTASLEEIQAAGRKAFGFGPKLPDDVLALFTSRVTSLQSRQRNRTILIGAAVGLGVLLILGGIAKGVAEYNRSQKAAAFIAQMDDLLERGDLAAARGLCNELAPEIAKDHGVGLRLLKLEDAEQSEEVRVVRFSALLSKIVESDPAGKEPDALVDEARALKRSNAEDRMIHDAIATRAKNAGAAKEKRERGWIESLKGLVARAEPLCEKARNSPPGEFPWDGLRGVQRDLSTLTEVLEKENAESLAEAKSLSARLEAAEKGARWRETEKGLRTDLGASQPGSDGFDRYLELLRKFAVGSPNLADVEKRRPVLAENPVWRGIAAWDELQATFSKQGAPKSVETVQRRSQELREFLKNHPTFPDAVFVDSYAVYLESLLNQFGGPSSAHGEIGAVLSDYLVSSLFAIKMENEDVYYVSEEPRFRGTLESETISYYVDFEKKTKRALIYKKNVHSSGLSEQSKWADEAKTILREATLSNWDEQMVKLLQSLWGNPSLEPLLKSALLKRIAKSAGAGSLALADAMEKGFPLTKLEHIDTSLHWMDPGVNCKSASDLARRVLSDLKQPNDMLPRVARNRNHYAATALRSYPAVAWLTHSGDGQWTAAPFEGAKLPFGQSVDLVLALPSAPGSPGKWSAIGKFTGGTFVLSDTSQCAEGRPVFLRLVPDGK